MTKIAALFTALVLGTLALSAAADAAPQWSPYATPNLSDSVQNYSGNGQ